MSGKRYFLDTNAIIQLLAGNQSLLELLNQADYVATSIICELEFHSFSNLPDEDRELFLKFQEHVQIVDLCSADNTLKEQIYKIRTDKQLKLPDAVVVASAIIEDCILITADKKLLSVSGLTVESYTLQ
jgi:tRNA(fMet)-specific endonuclease VapC